MGFLNYIKSKQIGLIYGLIVFLLLFTLVFMFVLWKSEQDISIEQPLIELESNVNISDEQDDVVEQDEMFVVPPEQEPEVYKNIDELKEVHPELYEVLRTAPESQLEIDQTNS